MIFSSIAFFVFFSVTLFIMALSNIRCGLSAAQTRALRRGILLAASYVFYGWWDWRFCFLMLGLSILVWRTAILIKKQNSASGKRFYVTFGVVIPLIALGFFKYFNFFVASFAAALGIHNTAALNIILPIGISFYTFQSLSYVIDVYRGKSPAVSDFSKLALYIAFFPQLVAGPIIKAGDFLPQLDEDRNISLANLQTGIQIFIFGLFKKIVIADWLSVFVDDVFRTPRAFHAISLILALIAYSIQIYFDFSGYSDMAIGCAKCLGYDFARNFNLPYISRSVTEFWQRWHISLSSWLKEYLYIPLGGNRKGNARTYINQLITMLLGGLWHGASWNFVLWGGLHGAALCVHKWHIKHFPSCPPRRTFTATLSTVAANIANNIFVCFCWLFFRADTFITAREIITGIVTWQKGIIQLYAWVLIAIVLVIAGTLWAILKQRGAEQINGFYPILDLSKFWHLVLFFIIAGCIAGLGYTGANPFIYFQF